MCSDLADIGARIPRTNKRGRQAANSHDMHQLSDPYSTCLNKNAWDEPRPSPVEADQANAAHA